MRRLLLLSLLVCAAGLCASSAFAQATGTQLPLVTLSPGYQNGYPGVTETLSVAVAAANGSGPVPTGSVTFTDFYDNATTTVGGTAQLKQGQSVWGFDLDVGSHEITAHYSGDGNYAPANSSPVTILIEKYSTNLNLTLSTASPKVGGTVTATASFSDPHIAQPTGSVTFTLDNSIVGVVPIVNDSSGTITATKDITISTAGTHTIGASYGGDASFASSTAPSATVTTIASPQPTITTLAAQPTSLTAGTPETLTATIAASSSSTSSSSTPFTGTVTFYDGSTLLGSPATVTSGQASISGITLSAATSHTITAVYSGDTNWLGSTSAPLVLSSSSAVTPSIVTLTVSKPVAVSGSLLTFTATVTPQISSTTPSAAPPVPTGTITFFDGNDPIGEATLVNNLGVATVTFFDSTLAGGSHTITAHYSGDSNYAAAVSSPLTVSIESYSITPAAVSLTLKQGQSGSILYSVSDTNGLNTSVQFSCEPPANTFTTCTFGPDLVAGDGQTTLNITTTGITSTAAHLRHLRQLGGGLLACFLLSWIPFGMRGRRRILRFLPLVVLAVLLPATAILSGCGTSGGKVTLSSTTPTPPGTLVFKVITAATVNSQTIQQVTYVTVNVLPAS
jgi:hypothetical protein